MTHTTSSTQVLSITDVIDLGVVVNAACGVQAPDSGAAWSEGGANDRV